ncbi:helix-turn-helix domain-containing protein [Fluviibacterium sp. S390]|uniref:helix-turn-helix domain-containing protein n=1 Tax=Fluviibacterium sp. S390 TaxID=3415139 RepID=UPI003C7A68FB
MAKRFSVNRVKANRHYTYEDVGALLGVTVQTVRAWSRQGLLVMADQKPHLILGQELVAFAQRRQAHKTKMPLDQFYCFRCKRRARPLDGIAFYTPQTSASGRLEGFCGHCEGPCGRFVKSSDLPKISTCLEVVSNERERA